MVSALSESLMKLGFLIFFFCFFSDDLIKYSFLLLRFSSSAFQLLRIYFPFPSLQCISTHVNSVINQYFNALKNCEISKINHLKIKKTLTSLIKFPIVLAIDAVCVTTISKHLPKKIGNLYSFTVYIGPLISENLCVPACLIEYKNGIGNKDIVKMLLNTSTEL